MKIYLSLAAGLLALGIETSMFMALMGIPPFGPGDDDVIWLLPFAGLLILGLAAIGLGTAITARTDATGGRSLRTAALVANGLSLGVPVIILLFGIVRAILSGR